MDLETNPEETEVTEQHQEAPNEDLVDMIGELKDWSGCKALQAVNLLCRLGDIGGHSHKGLMAKKG